MEGKGLTTYSIRHVKLKASLCLPEMSSSEHELKGCWHSCYLKVDDAIHDCTLLQQVPAAGQRAVVIQHWIYAVVCL